MADEKLSEKLSTPAGVLYIMFAVIQVEFIALLAILGFSW